MASYTSAFTENEFLTLGDVSVTTDSYNRIGAYKVEAGERVTLGQGNKNSFSDAIGRIYVDLKDNASTPANVDGKLRFVINSPQDQHKQTLVEFNTRQLRTDASDLTKQVPFAEFNTGVKEDSKLVVEFKPETDTTVSATNSTMLVGMTLEYI